MTNYYIIKLDGKYLKKLGNPPEWTDDPYEAWKNKSRSDAYRIYTLMKIPGLKLAKIVSNEERMQDT